MSQKLLTPNERRRDSSEPLLPLPRCYRIPSLPLPDRFSPSATLKKTIYLSVVLPTYQERTNLPGMVAVLSHLLDETLPDAYELIVVDDNSPDRTWKIAQQLAHHYPALQVIRRTDERGLATAVVCGWEIAQGEVLGVIDTDFQQPPEVLLDLLVQIQQGADLAIASRHAQGGGIRNWSLARRLLSQGAHWLGRLLLPGVMERVSDPTSGYFLIRREAISDRPLSPSGYKILLEVLSRGTIQHITEVGYVFHGRPDDPLRALGSKFLSYLRHLAHLWLDRRRTNPKAVLKIKSIGKS